MNKEISLAGYGAGAVVGIVFVSVVSLLPWPAPLRAALTFGFGLFVHLCYVATLFVKLFTSRNAENWRKVKR